MAHVVTVVAIGGEIVQVVALPPCRVRRAHRRNRPPHEFLDSGSAPSYCCRPTPYCCRPTRRGTVVAGSL